MSTIKSSAENLTLNADGSNNDVIIQSDGSTLVTVDGSASGVGIGTTTPSAALEVKNTTDGSTFAFQATNDNDHEIVQIGAQADGDGYLTVHGQGASTNIKVKLDSDGTSSIDGGDLSIGNGNLVIGTAGKGIDFAANANSSATGASTTSEILDDYEEGTWTPTLFGSGGGTGSWNAAYDHGSYTKVGRLVTFNAYTIASSLGDMSNATRIGGLPFTVSATGGYFTANFSGAQGLDIDAGDSLTGFININSDWILVQLWNATTGTAAYGFYIEELSADGGFIISGQYFTDS